MEKRKKIVFINPTLAIGGLERALVNLANSIDNNKYIIVIKTLFWDDKLACELNNEIRHEIIFKPIKIMGLNIKGLRRFYSLLIKMLPSKLLYKIILGKEKYDIEIAYYWGECAKIISGSTSKAKKILFIHSNINYKNNGFHVGFKNNNKAMEATNKFNDIIFVSRPIKEEFLNKTNITINTHVINNINNIKEIKDKSIEKIDINGYENKLIICTIGRLVEVKGIDRALEACRRLNNEEYIYEYWIIGSGEKEKDIKKYVNENKLKNIRVLGNKDNPYKYLAKSSIYLCSSYAEGLSCTVAEAIILNIPIISTDCGGPKEYIGNSEYGMLVENTVEGIYKGLKNILDDKNMLNELKKKTIKRFEYLEPERIINQIEKVFEGKKYE